MKSKFLNIAGVQVLSKESQKNILGGISGDYDLSKCGCSCSGSVTGPFYCQKFIACPQVYTCHEEI
ncbi:hypothetical protein [Flavobacterium sp. J27]|uniref:hypothetical protein n=1 Tax=Flavobacterium sp. J27 TaxID=2060419 RepID=UPI0010316786|nr:hypothetical protein [Flavobacterium sp. J27]